MFTDHNARALLCSTRGLATMAEAAATSATSTSGAPHRKKQVVVLGMMSRHPVAGVIWQTIHYLLGLERLNYKAYYVEATALQPSAMLAEGEADDRSVAAATFINSTLQRFDLGNRWAFHALQADGHCYGMSEAELMNLYHSADLIINLHGATVPRPEHNETNRLVYLETDPVAVQIELFEQKQETIDYLEPHCAFFTFGENYGQAGCKLPVSKRFTFRPTRQPVLVDYWRNNAPPNNPAFTTIGNWKQQWRNVEFQGETFTWSKHFEFLKFMDLPLRTEQPFELALSRCGAGDRRKLERKGWQVRDALPMSLEIDPYRSYIQGSRGEFTVAKDQNIRLRTGWFSDRSASYLASGRPVITQETGFSNILPTGEGLFAFSTKEGILEAIERINTDYARHSQAAAAIAHEHFSHDVVLGALLREVGL
jgi:hypothetical protein